MPKSKKNSSIFTSLSAGIKKHINSNWIYTIAKDNYSGAGENFANSEYPQVSSGERNDSLEESYTDGEDASDTFSDLSVKHVNSPEKSAFQQPHIDNIGALHFPHPRIQKHPNEYFKEPAKNIRTRESRKLPMSFTHLKDGKKYNFNTPKAFYGILHEDNDEEKELFDESYKSESLDAVNNKESYQSKADTSFSADTSLPTNSAFEDNIFFQSFDNKYDPYPMWNDKAPISKKAISKKFEELEDIFMFQKDNVSNIFEYLLRLLDSRSSRMSPEKALRSLYLDYIGGEQANFRKWYFASKCDDDDFNSHQKKSKKSLSLEELEKIWFQNYTQLTTTDYIVQLSLFLLIWGEAGQLRYMPECLCFIYKCCIDYYYHLTRDKILKLKCEPFLDHAITPIYNYCVEQQYHLLKENTLIPKDKDHAAVIGYDDINQFFWFRKSLLKIPLKQKRKKLYDYPVSERYLHLNECNWEKTFKKTYKEFRTWYHILTNFHRILVIHICTFWYFTIFNFKSIFTKNYKQTLNNQPSLEFTFSILSLSGSLACFFTFLALLGEFCFCPRKFYGSTPILKRFFLTLILFVIVTIPSGYLIFTGKNTQPTSTNAASQNLFFTSAKSLIFHFQFLFSFALVLYFSFTPLNKLYFFDFRSHEREFLANIFFTDSVVPLEGLSNLSSVCFWVFIFAFKFLESYFFLTLSLKDSLRELNLLNYNKCVRDSLFTSNFFCKYQSKILLFLVVLVDLVLFFLDTYLWYIIANTLFSVFRSFYIGVSIWTPWKNIFARLPSRIYMKVLNSDVSDPNFKQKLIADIWNSIIISMYREHLISFEHVQKLIYTKILAADKTILKEPSFFINQEDVFYQSFLFKKEFEAQRRITFFAQSLSIPIPNSYSINEMPSFTVLIPHYKEKIMLSLREIIKSCQSSSEITLLEYLKNLHRSEWNYFVEDTKQLVAESNFSIETGFNDSAIEKKQLKYKNGFGTRNKFENLSTAALDHVGFEIFSPEHILRTRIWASLRAQTLYRTITGFMNYSKAIKILYDVEDQTNHTSTSLKYESNLEDNTLEQETSADVKVERASILALRKFTLLVSMQKLTSFETEEELSTNFLLRAYPELQIAYIEHSTNEKTGLVEYYSCLVDGACEILENEKRKPKYRIKLSGNPILGDGKADNQNHAVIFARGEFLQLIDANQDNYLEECLKIRNVLAEFEFSISNFDFKKSENTLYEPIHKRNIEKYDIKKENIKELEFLSSSAEAAVDEISEAFFESKKSPVAIVGTREYIFSENIGILGDVAAGKEQTFGTSVARTMAKVGGKLHYGHPDFLNTIFMCTRGGVSKGQKGLHLNEDIYSGMNALLRGGRIKHCEYIQCGKGRDLGFGSILNFSSKIGAGMGEQFLSREYFYLGTQLPLDRFLSFYYAHPGFQLNNALIMTCIKLFVLIILNLAFMVSNSVLCAYDKNVPFTDPRYPSGCANLMPIVKWLRRTILSIFSVFFVSSIPLFFQELMERGTWKAASRILKQFISFSSLFEIFVCKVYSTSLVNDLTIGGARYIATGRGFATTRSPFNKLYARFAPEAFYYASITLILLLSASFASWDFSFLYFWNILLALMLAPFLFNPNQFLWNEFFLDYKAFLHWMNSGNSIYKKDKFKFAESKTESSWISYIKCLRTTTIGSKKQFIKKNKYEKYFGGFFVKSPSKFNIFFNKILSKTFVLVIIGSSYLFDNSQNLEKSGLSSNAVLRIFLISFGPLIINVGILVASGSLTIITGPFLSLIFSKYSSLIAILVHSFGILNHLFFFQLLFAFQNWSVSETFLGFALSCSIQNLIITFVSSCILTNELTYTDRSNKAWWSGRWLSSELGARVLTQPFREFLCKCIEMSWFTADVFISHFLFLIQIPVLFIPYIDKWHSFMLLWLKPSEQLTPRALSIKSQKKKKIQIYLYSFLFFFIIFLLLISVLGPFIVVKTFKLNSNDLLPEQLHFLIKPKSNSEISEMKKGLQGYKTTMKKVNLNK